MNEIFDAIKDCTTICSASEAYCSDQLVMQLPGRKTVEQWYSEGQADLLTNFQVNTPARVNFPPVLENDLVMPRTFLYNNSGLVARHTICNAYIVCKDFREKLHKEFAGGYNRPISSKTFAVVDSWKME